MAHRDLLPDVPCSGPGCTANVKQRRRSATGKHWCKRKECQTAKQRFYREQREGPKDTGPEIEKANAKVKQYETGLLSMIDLLTDTTVGFARIECPGCGRPDAIRGFPHPSLSDRSPCDAVNRESEPRILPNPVLNIVWKD